MDTHTHYDTAAHVKYGVEAYTNEVPHKAMDQLNTKVDAPVAIAEFGRGWYHDAAIADHSPARKYEA